MTHPNVDNPPPPPTQGEQDLDVASQADTALDIGRPNEEVFAYLADFARRAQWAHTCLAVATLTPGPTRVGSRYAVTERQDLRWDRQPLTALAHREGHDFQTMFEVTALEPCHEIAWRTQTGDAPFLAGTGGEWCFIVAPISGSITRVRLRGRIDGPQPALLAWMEELRRVGYPLDVIQRQADRGLHNLRTILEGRAGGRQHPLAFPQRS